jgi:hypothetical protein
MVKLRTVAGGAEVAAAPPQAERARTPARAARERAADHVG